MEGFVDVELARDGHFLSSRQSKQLQTSPETFSCNVIKDHLAEWPEEMSDPWERLHSIVGSVRLWHDFTASFINTHFIEPSMTESPPTPTPTPDDQRTHRDW